MAGVSGGRKSVCPGLIAEDSINIFHGAAMLAEPKVESMILEANPCHEEALAVALMAGVDYIINVTLDHDFQVTGVFAGDLIQAHEKAVEHLRATTCIPVQREYDIVVAHAGFVGINHYQAAKVGVTAIPIVKPQGKLIVVADNTDIDPVGSPFYRTALHLLKHLGPEQFESLIQSSNWRFLPEQWQVQMWAKLFKKITFDDFVYYSPQLKAEDYVIVPGRNGNFYLPNSRMYQDELENIADVVETAVQSWMSSMQVQRSEEISIAYMADGPYGIPIVR